MTLKNWATSLEVSGVIRTSLGAEVQPEYFFLKFALCKLQLELSLGVMYD